VRTVKLLETYLIGKVHYVADTIVLLPDKRAGSMVRQGHAVFAEGKAANEVEETDKQSPAPPKSTPKAVEAPKPPVKATAPKPTPKPVEAPKPPVEAPKPVEEKAGPVDDSPLGVTFPGETSLPLDSPVTE
jgi:hypothetical protein